jgi:drug/metabolite transporter (DMT)-like permease
MATIDAASPAVDSSPINWRPYIVLGAGVCVGSIGVVFIRNAQLLGIPTLAIVTLRLLLTLSILTPLVLRRYHDQLRQLSRTDLLLAGVAGVMFGLGLITGFESLNHTTVLIAGVLGASTPLWVALLERSVLKTRLHRNVWIGLALALAGSSFIALSGLGGGVGDNPLVGAGLSVASAFVTAVYFIVSRSMRPRVSLLPYIWILCSFAAITSIVFTLISRVSLTGYPLEGYFWILLVTLGPQLIVQSSFSYALGYFSATSVGIVTQLVTVGNAAAAFVVYDQVPQPIQLVGSVVILAGVTIANIRQHEKRHGKR